MNADSDNAPIHSFWSWLQDHRAALDAMDTPEHPFWDEVLERLQDMDEGLWMEVSMPGAAPRELVLTAGGDPGLFALVERIVSLAPPLDGWLFVALKPPMGFGFTTRYEGIDLNPAEMWFAPLVSEEAPEILGLSVAVPGFVDDLEQEIGSGVLILLDTALGERSAAIDVELVEVCEVPLQPDEEGFLPLGDLMNYIEWRRHQRAAGA